jgi:FkbM family methyltransferase
VISRLKNSFWKCFTIVDAKLKFPNLKKGGVGIQLGFDMTFPLTSDLFTMHKRVVPNGFIIGIDPDPFNHQIAQKVIIESNLNIKLIQKGTFSKKATTKFLIGEKSSWNQLKDVPKDSTVPITEKEIDVEIDQLDTIISDMNIDIQKIVHINLTINGAEYDTLLGMDKILKEIQNLSLTVIAGRYDESGTINGEQDYEMILPLLHSYGFTTKFKRIHHLFWWGFVVKLFLNRKWIYNQPNFGIIMASKGTHQLKWYQSFS